MAFEKQEAVETVEKNPENMTENLESVNIERLETMLPKVESWDLENQTSKLNNIFEEEMSRFWIDFRKIYEQKLKNPVWKLS